MNVHLIAPLLLLIGCFGESQDDDTWVTATIDDQAYEGNVGGAHLFEQDPGWLLLFPSDLLQGSVFGWTEGETGAWELAYEDACEVDCHWLQYQQGSATYISSTGTLSIDGWEAIEPENAADMRLGYATGTFDSSLFCWMGCEGAAETVEITDGDFRVMVTRSAS